MSATGDNLGSPTTGHTAPDPTEPKRPDKSLGELVASLGDDLSNLLSTQIEIAKKEVQQEATKAAKGAGMLGGAAVAGLLAVVLLSSAAAWGIAEAWDAWAGFLIIGLLWAIVAGALALVGKKKLDQTRTTPERTLEELRADRELAQSVSR